MFVTTRIILISIALTTAALGLNAGETAGPVPDGRTQSLYATVEKDGNLVTGLSEENFRLYEDGKPMAFRLEEPETPVAITLLVEYSRGSWFYVNDILRAVEGFQEAAPQGNWYSLVTFDEDANVIVDFTKRTGEILSAFSRLRQPMWDHIETYQAVYDVLDKLSRLNRRSVVIFVGSGFDTFSPVTLEEVGKKVESTNVQLYCVGAGSQLRGYYEPYLGDSARLELLQAESFLRMLSDKSGGQAWFPRFESAIPDVMKGIMQTLEHQYRLVYNSEVPSDGKLHKVKVEAFHVVDGKRTDFRVRVREGWRF